MVAFALWGAWAAILSAAACGSEKRLTDVASEGGHQSGVGGNESGGAGPSSGGAGPSAGSAGISSGAADASGTRGDSDASGSPSDGRPSVLADAAALPVDATERGDVAVQGFLHPGLLHSNEDFDRMRTKVAANAQPWKAGWDRLVANGHSALTWTARPAPVVYRGADGVHPENYAQLFNDAAAAYALALRWKISGDAAYADKAIAVLDAWSAVLTSIGGTSDKFLAAGLYGYELANAGEIMRTYAGWSTADFTQFKSMMQNVFYSMNHDFLLHHNGACISHYWANWDLCNMDSMIAIGVLLDDRAIYDEAVEYFKNGAGNGAIGKAVFFVHPGHLGQWQESGRDQGHNTLGIGLMGAFCEMAWKQGDDLYAYDDNRFLAGAEYVATYNLGNDVPYVTYDNCDNVNQTVIASAGRGDIRPIWELVYNHYVNRRGLAAPNVASYAAMVRPEGGGGDYGPNSGGYDQLGYGTLTFTLPPPPAP